MQDLLSYPDRSGAKRCDTAFQAADKIAGKAATLRHRIYKKLEEVAPFGLSADELADAIGESILACRPRVSELRAQGMVKPSAVRRKNASGLSAVVWVLA